MFLATYTVGLIKKFPYNVRALTFSEVSPVMASFRLWVSTMVKTACERELTAFMLVEATVLWDRNWKNRGIMKIHVCTCGG